MKIGIIGAGNMGSALAKIWADSGHPVMLSYSSDRASPCQSQLPSLYAKAA